MLELFTTAMFSGLGYGAAAICTLIVVELLQSFFDE